MPPNGSRTIFVANLPFDVSEEQLANVFSEAGPVNNVEIKFDPATGKSKGYAFVQFYDDATALSAVRNLQSVPVNGRNLRVEPSTDEPTHRRDGGGGRRGGRGGPPMGDYSNRDRSPPRDYGRPPPGSGPLSGAGGYGAPGRRIEDDSMYPPGPGLGGRIDINALPPGTEVGGQNPLDAISKTLAAVSPGQMQEVMAGMKTLIATQPDQARQLLANKPQLAYALFQAMLLMNIVDPAVLGRIQAVNPAQPVQPSYPPQPQPTYPPTYPTYPAPNPQSIPPPAPAPAPTPAYGTYPPPPVNSATTYRPPAPPQVGGYGAPPPPQGYGGYTAPPPQSGMAQAQAALAGTNLPEDQKAMLLQVLSLTTEQINALDPTQKASIMALRQQFLGAAA